MTVQDALDRIRKIEREDEPDRDEINRLKVAICDVLLSWMKQMPYDDWRTEEISID